MLLLEGLLWRCGSAVACRGALETAVLEGAPWHEVINKPIIEPTDARAGSPQAKQLTRRECNPSADNWVKALLNKASRHQFLPPGSLHKPLSLIHQRADKRRKKRHSLTVAKIKTALQKGNHDEKAESCVPDEGTR